MPIKSGAKVPHGWRCSSVGWTETGLRCRVQARVVCFAGGHVEASRKRFNQAYFQILLTLGAYGAKE